MGKTLSAAQREAAFHFTGPCLCMAGPGSGKTLVITERIATLVRTYGVEPGQILVVTFTRDAAASMKRRSEEEGHITPSPAFGTFHSIFYNILLKEGQIRPERLISGRRALGFLSLCVNECGLKEANKEYYPALLKAISYYKNTGILDEDLYPTDTSTEDMKRIIEAFARVTVREGFFDFDDILVETRRFFAAHPQKLDKWRKKFPFILVDEAQDMNRLQYEIIRMLASPLDNLFLVGDDDQAIYGFRGSDPSFLLKFKEDYREASTVILDKNYRSASEIVSASSGLISHNRMRFEKDLQAFREESGHIELLTSADEHEEARLVAGMIKEALDSGTPPSQVAVIYRNRLVSTCLMQEIARISQEKGTRDAAFIKSPVFNDLLAYLRISQSQVVSRDQFVTALTRPDRNIGIIGAGRELIDKREWLLRMEKTLFASEARSFIRDIDFISRLSPASAISFVMKKMGYARFIRDCAYKNGTDPSLLNGYARLLSEEASRFRRIDAFCQQMEEVRDHVLYSEKEEKTESSIGFYTFHGSKGLEFDTVFIIGACDGITPSDKAVTAERVEEERRMFYVAMTRARRCLFISVCGKYGNHSYYPSPFIREAFGGDGLAQTRPGI